MSAGNTAGKRYPVETERIEKQQETQKRAAKRQMRTNKTQGQHTIYGLYS